MHLSDLILIKKEGEYFYTSGKMLKNKFQSMIFLQLKAFFVEILVSKVQIAYKLFI